MMFRTEGVRDGRVRRTHVGVTGTYRPSQEMEVSLIYTDNLTTVGIDGSQFTEHVLIECDTPPPREEMVTLFILH